MLHVTNGDAAAEAIRSTGLDGAVLVWRDVLHEGPVPGGASVLELREIRAGFLARCGWAERAQALADFAARDERLGTALRSGEEVVLWFEDDLFDQLQLVQVLDRVASGAGRARVTAVSTESYFGLLPAPEMTAAFARARLLEAPEFVLARTAWAAFRSEDPRGLEALLAAGTEELPALEPALRRLLEQFPGVTDGLSRSERQALAALAGGALPFEELFDRAQRSEERRFLGDLVFRHYLDGLAQPPAPLLASSEEGEVWRLTDLGRRVIHGEADRLAFARLDRWLGGVRLVAPHRVWRWDAAGARLVPPVRG
ncbi:MAG: DUF1835 domain-containing protein [Thermoanaerobaculia bacterium]|nr:MAG: DUF1835 domain-containing protein [Thermoanaerobaculia bacterium]